MRLRLDYYINVYILFRHSEVVNTFLILNTLVILQSDIWEIILDLRRSDKSVVRKDVLKEKVIAIPYIFAQKHCSCKILNKLADWYINKFKTHGKQRKTCHKTAVADEDVAKWNIIFTSIKLYSYKVTVVRLGNVRDKVKVFSLKGCWTYVQSDI